MGDSRTIMPIWDAKFKSPLSHDNHGDRTRGHTNYCRRTIIFNQVWDGWWQTCRPSRTSVALAACHSCRRLAP